MGWKKSAPYGASDLAKIRAGFLHKAERLLHGAQIAKNLENSDKWYDALGAGGAAAQGVSGAVGVAQGAAYPEWGGRTSQKRVGPCV